MNHQWVKHTITPVYTLDSEGGDPIIIVDPDDQDSSEYEAVYGCHICDLPLTPENFNTECQGEVDENAKD